MTNESNRSLDVLGTKPIADAALVLTKATVDGVGAFLSRICLPAAEEFGLMVRDRVSAWRQVQATSILQKTEKLVAERETGASLKLPPRLAMLALEQGSWSDDDQVQNMWAGLLASACTEDGKSEDNLIFMNILSQLTAVEVRLVDFMCINSEKYLTEGGFVGAFPIEKTNEEALEISAISDVHMLDFQLDHLRESGLMPANTGFHPERAGVILLPSAFSLGFFVRCQGFIGTPKDYFDDVKRADELEPGEVVRRHAVLYD